MYTLQLCGAMELRAPDGTDRTPRLAKTQGLLAFLALAGGRAVNRTRLQDLLWSDRGEKQGRDSLRKALSELRVCLNAVDPNPLITTGGPVRLCQDNLKVVLDSFESSALYRPEFLEGIDILDPEFNIWLSQTRANIGRETGSGLVKIDAVAKVWQSASDGIGPLLELGILPIIGTHNGQGFSIADMLADAISELCLECAIIRPYDFRAQSIKQAVSYGPDVLLSIRHSTIGSIHFFALNFQTAGDFATLFSTTLRINLAEFTSEWVMEKCAEIFDQLCEKVVRYEGFSEPRHLAAKQLFFAIDRIFRLSNFDLDQAGTFLEEVCQYTDASTVYAWNAFLTAFRLEKVGRNYSASLIEQAENYASKALEKDPHNALSAALVGHVYGFVLKDKNRAAELLSNFKEKAHYQPMLADTIAMHCYYQGKFKEARSYAELAAKIGRFNPFRYSFTTSLAMTNLMCGDLQPALTYCRAALAQHPVKGGTLYEPTLRTLAAAAGHAGEFEAGRLAYRNLAEQTGGAPLENINEAAFPNLETLDLVKSGMEKLNA